MVRKNVTRRSRYLFLPLDLSHNIDYIHRVENIPKKQFIFDRIKTNEYSEEKKLKINFFLYK